MSNVKDIAKSILELIFEKVDDEGEACCTSQDYARCTRQKGYGYDKWHCGGKSLLLFTQEFLNEYYSEEKALIIFFTAVWHATNFNEACMDVPKHLPKSVSGYKGSSFIKNILENCINEIREIHSTFKAEEKMATKTAAKNSAQKTVKGSVKNRVMTTAKKAAKKVVVRKVSRRLVTNVIEVATKALENHPVFGVLVASPIGRAAVPALLAMGLAGTDFLPLPEGFRETIEPFKDELIDELTTQAMDEGTAPMEELALALLPHVKDALAPMLMGGGAAFQIAEKATEAPEKIKATVKSTKAA